MFTLSLLSCTYFPIYLFTFKSLLYCVLERVPDETFGVFDPIHEPNNLQDGYGFMHMLSSYMFTCKL